MATKRRFGRLRQLKSGNWQAGYRAPDGQNYLAPTTFTRKTDGAAWLDRIEDTISRGTWARPTTSMPALTLAQYGATNLARRQLKPSTRALYEQLWDARILSQLGDLPLSRLTPAHIRTWYDRQTADAPTARAHAYALLRSVCADAVAEGLLDANPCRIRGAAKPARARTPEVLTAAEITAYLDALPKHRRAIMSIIVWCGLRSGEARALRRRDLDLDTGVVTVRRSVTRVKGQLLVDSPKTPAAIRDITIPPHVVRELRAWVIALPMRGRDSLLFPAGDGVSPLSDTTLAKAHARARMAVGKPGLTIHDLRRTSATLAAQQGATMAEIMRRLGHTTVQVALLYQQPTMDRDRQLAERMSAATTEGG